MAEVRLIDIKKVYDNGFEAVHSANIHIKDKEFMVLVGPSGCGKSTTLRMVAGLEEITSGNLFIDDILVNDLPPKDRDIAMVFQNYALYPHMSVYDNMAFGLKLHKFAKTEIDKRVKEAAEILGITSLLKNKPKELSGGQRQRVAVGRSIVRKPKVFLFDEPLSNLDAKLRVQMRTEISKLHNELQTTMIYVTHDQVEAMTMGDRITVMKDGLIHQIDTPLNLYNHPKNKFVAGFIGSPAMNFINGELIKEEDGVKFHCDAFSFHLPDALVKKLENYIGKKICCGIRPEDIYDIDFAPGIDASESFSTIVEVVEPMGNEVFLYVNSSNISLVTRLAPRKEYEYEQPVSMVFNLAKTHFFDIETEKTLVSALIDGE